MHGGGERENDGEVIGGADAAAGVAGIDNACCSDGLAMKSSRIEERREGEERRGGREGKWTTVLFWLQRVAQRQRNTREILDRLDNNKILIYVMQTTQYLQDLIVHN